MGPGPCRSPGATEVHSCLCAWIKKSTLLIVLIGPAWSGLCCALRFYVVVVQTPSLVQLFSTPCTVALQASPSFTVFRSLLKLVSIESVVPSHHLILCHSLLSCLKSFPASGSFPMSRLFTSGGQSSGASALASVLLMNIQG